ncbi:hypothetical protein M8J76_005399 [Diaphorina citri]|nr:hypothetical protein M8J76_005399 [Diaphorina citri]KAI5731754.1 hypothetical protein M8J77_015505 [Diaphorina citri]
MVMAHGIKQQMWEDNFIKTANNTVKIKAKKTLVKAVKPNSGTRRIFSPQFKLQVLDSYRQDSDCQGNQRATARKYGIHRRQIQKWLQMETSLRCTVKANNNNNNNNNVIVSDSPVSVLNISSSGSTRQCGDITRGGETNTNMADSCDVSEEEYVNVDEITDSEDSEEALDLSIKLKLNQRDLNEFSNRGACTVDDFALKNSPPSYPLYPLPPCCYLYSWNYGLPSPPTSASILVEKPQPRRQHLPLDFTNYLYDRPDSFHLYRIHSF